MKTFAFRTAFISTGASFVLLLTAPTAQAQLGDLLKKGGESVGTSGDLGNLGGFSVESLTSGSVGNVAGLLQYCISNNHLGGDAASSVKDKLMGKLPGGSSTNDSNYKDGAKGILNSGNGQQFNLNSSSLKEQATKQICDKVLAQGKSML